MNKQWLLSSEDNISSPRKGKVRGQGRSFIDDEGMFFPYGATLFSALRLYKDELARLKDNLSFISSSGNNSIRILTAVKWNNGLEVSPSWSIDYLERTINLAYGYGLRTDVCIFGSSYDSDTMLSHVNNVLDVCNKNSEKIQSIECYNEYFAYSVPPQLVQAVRDYVKSKTSILVSPSTEQNGLPFFGGSLATTHPDRNDSTIEGKARQIRQCWDLRDSSLPTYANEPSGPLSSVVSNNDPLQLAMMRYTFALCSVKGFVLHNGAGVYSTKMEAQGSVPARPANLWEVENIKFISQAVKNVERFMPLELGEGVKYNWNWNGQPLRPDAIWVDGSDHGVTRVYSEIRGGLFSSAIIGIKDHVVLTAGYNMQFSIIDPIKGPLSSFNIKKDSTIPLSPSSIDQQGLGHLIIQGMLL